MGGEIGGRGGGGGKKSKNKYCIITTSNGLAPGRAKANWKSGAEKKEKGRRLQEVKEGALQEKPQSGETNERKKRI